MRRVKALSLFSGGLDSILSCRVIMEQGIEVKALHFITPFFGYHKKGREEEFIEKARKNFGIDMAIIDVSDEYMEVARHPRYGYGKNLNPCLDCKIFLFSKARGYLAQEGASFLITGEVIGQRPMSQRRDTLNIVERDSGTKGILLRPLCARHLAPTIPEREGWVERSRLLDFKGRGRKSQMALAVRFGITDYPTPAGGCLLADPIMSGRIRWTFRNFPDCGVQDMVLTSLGRHFALAEKTLLVVGRSEKENDEITRLGRRGDIQLELLNRPGPVSLLRGPRTHEIIMTAASITAYHSKAREEKQVDVFCSEVGSGWQAVLTVDPLSEDALASYRIA